MSFSSGLVATSPLEPGKASARFAWKGATAPWVGSIPAASIRRSRRVQFPREALMGLVQRGWRAEVSAPDTAVFWTGAGPS